MKKEITCTVCPRGCSVTVEGTADRVTSVSGNSCKRGAEFATSEFLNPVRILTTLVGVAGDPRTLIPVRTDRPIPKDKLFTCMAVIKKARATLPVKRGDVLVKNVADTGANVIATKDVL